MKGFSHLRFHLPDDSNFGQIDKELTGIPGMGSGSLPGCTSREYLPFFLFGILEASLMGSED